ncbi:MAG: hypothetical protein KC731_32990, partial [Myxococcales bacterium]|nr:hypothetical protein [Myxococcales bacterium]
IVYEMLTGEIPGRYWGVETLSELPMKVAFEELAPASQRAGRNAPLLPAGFDAWFSRCLAKNAEERFPTAGEAIGQLLQLLADDVHEVTDEDLEGVSTRLHSSPVPTADQARTRVKSVQSAKGSIKTPSSNTSEPPPLPRISSPAITVTPRADDSDQHAAVTTPPPVVRSETTTTRRNDPGGSRWGLAFAGLALVAGVAGAVAYERSQKATAAATCIQDGNTAECESACQSGNVASCAELGFQIAATDAEHARGLLEKACGVAPVADTAALRAWTVKVESAGCVEGQCVAAACVELAAMHEQGRGGALQSARAASSLYKRTCRVGLDDKPRGSEGCVGLGAERERAGEIEAARQFYAAACEDGISEGCVDLAHILERGNGEWRDEKRARELYQKACDGGDLKGCTRLGSMVERGRGGW